MIRRLLYLFFLVLVAILIVTRFTELEDIAATILQADWRFLAVAFAVQLFLLLNNGFYFWTLYNGLGIRERTLRLTLLSSAGFAVGVLTPVAGTTSLAVFVADGRLKGLPSGKITVAGVLSLLYDYLAFLAILALGLIIFFRRNILSARELVPTAILAAMAGGITYFIVVGLRSEVTLGNSLAKMTRLGNRMLKPLLRKEIFKEENAVKFAHETVEGLQELRKKSKLAIILPFVPSFVHKLLLMFILFLVFKAYQAPFSPGTIIAGFGIGYLFVIVSITPAGLGVVEGTFPLALTALGVPLGTAVIITLTYRAVTFWFPFLIGLWSLRRVLKPTRNENPTPSEI